MAVSISSLVHASYNCILHSCTLCCNFHYLHSLRQSWCQISCCWLQSILINLPERPSLAHQRLAGMSQRKDETSQRHPGSHRGMLVSPVGWLWTATISRLAVASQRLAVPSQEGIYACTNACMDGQTYGHIFSLSICWSLWIPLCPLLKKVH